MRTTLLMIVLTIFAASNCHGQWGRMTRVKGSGKIETDSRNLGYFEAIKASQSIAVYVTKGEQDEIRIEADDNLLEYVVTEIESNRLRIAMKEGVNTEPSTRVKVFVSTPKLTGLKSSSSSKVYCEGKFSGDDLKLDVSSSGFIEMHFSGNSVAVKGSSSGKVKLAGSSDHFQFKGSSSTRIDAREFVAKRVKARGSSSARLAIEVTEELDADLSSSARVEYKGNPDKVLSDVSSGGKVRKMD